MRTKYLGHISARYNQAKILDNYSETGLAGPLSGISQVKRKYAMKKKLETTSDAYRFARLR